jgi:hypothetical protein
MLSNAIMGAIALGILWINALLIAAANAKEALALVRLRRRFAPSEPSREGPGLRRARVVSGSASGPLAVQRVEQRGRAAAPRRGRGVIHFGDRSMEGELLGGTLAIDGVEGEVTLLPSREVEIWCLDGELERAAACPSDEAFDQAHEQAKKARGLLRTVEGAVLPGAQIFVYGDLRPWGKGHLLGAAAEGGLLLATGDPRAFLLRTVLRFAAFIVAEIAVCAGATALALHEPVFELTSKLGAALCLLFFILVQPLSVSLRDASRLPSRAFLRGSWTRSAPLSRATSASSSEQAGAAAP